MADHAVNGVPSRSFPEWHPDGVVPPQLISNLEWVIKGRMGALRRRKGRALPAPAQFDLAALYSTISSGRLRQTVMLKRMLRLGLGAEQGIDVTFAALILATTSEDGPRAGGLLAFLALCYPVEQLDQAVPRMRRQMEALEPQQRDAVAGLVCEAGWEPFAASVRVRIESMPPAVAPAPSRRLPALPPRRVVVRLSGGLGNQMFQYAAALAYARRVDLPLRLDLANYEATRKDREFLLGRLCVPVRRANSFEVAWTRLRPHRHRGAALDEFMFEDHGSAWLSGFWENSAYFANILPAVRRRFSPRDPELIARIAALIESARRDGGPVVGVHLRRGDRAAGGTAFAPFSTLPPAYYREAARRFPPDASFLVFSDTPEDIEWCRAHLGLGSRAAITFGEGRDPILDLFALVQCNHVILSAGTFSWWAGYLGGREGRRVIVPNALQGLSAEWATLLCRRPEPGWEEVTLPPGSGT